MVVYNEIDGISSSSPFTWQRVQRIRSKYSYEDKPSKNEIISQVSNFHRNSSLHQSVSRFRFSCSEIFRQSPNLRNRDFQTKSKIEVRARRRHSLAKRFLPIYLRKKEEDKQLLPCFAGFNSFVLNPNGDVYPYGQLSLFSGVSTWQYSRSVFWKHLAGF